MKLKLFNIRLTAENAPHDQDALNHFMDCVEVKKTATQYVPDTPDFWSILVFYDDLKQKHTQTVKITESDLVGEERALYDALRLWRKDRAMEINLPEFMVFHNNTLMQVARNRPTTINALEEIKGMGAQKLSRYGDDILAIVAAF